MRPWAITMRRPLEEVIGAIVQMLLSGYAPEGYEPEYVLSDARSYLLEYHRVLCGYGDRPMKGQTPGV